VLSPIITTKSYERVNDASLVVSLRLKDRRVILTGDAEAEAEAEMVSRFGARLRADVLKLGHHGSNTSSAEAFLDQVRPEHAIASLGRDNRFGFPHAAVVDRLARRGVRLWRTDREGMITIRTDGTALEVVPFR
jgi:competence protein ComEC